MELLFFPCFCPQNVMWSNLIFNMSFNSSLFLKNNVAQPSTPPTSVNTGSARNLIKLRFLGPPPEFWYAF